MEAERYKKIDELFDAALDLESAARASFLDAACAGDAELRTRVEALLRASEKAEQFIETPALEVAAKSLAADGAPSLIGQKISHYEVESLLGAGGMGEVYLAEDPRLRRKVALKVLPSRFTADPDRLSRFQREARAASALNHPNIVTVFEIGNDRGTHFIASEYVEGDTLRDCITRGDLSVKEAIEIAMQVASALAAAHQAGIVHRDIKPENLMRRKDGYVKVLDFGLVKLADGGDLFGTQQSLATRSGAVMGTINYMSPEQALGQAVDQRTDIFALGAVLYEMIAGVAPFKGATPAATFDAILNRQPPPLANTLLEPSVELQHIIARALEKDRDLRYQTAADFSADLKRLQRNRHAAARASSRLSATPGKSVSHWWMKAALAFGVLTVFLVALLLTGVRLLDRQPASDWTKATVTKVTDFVGIEMFPSLSHDGKTLVYSSRMSGNDDIYVKRVGARKIVNVTEGSTADDTQPALSPDGKRIAFRSSRQGGGIFIMSETGESVRQLTNFGFNPAWSPDGKEIACTENYVQESNRTLIPSRLWVVNISTEESRVLQTGDAVQASWSPSGKRIAYWGVHNGTQRDIWTIPAGGGEPVAVTNDAAVDFNPVWSPSGDYLYFISNRKGIFSLWRVAIDEQSGKAASELEWMPTPATAVSQFSLSGDGKRLAYAQWVSAANAQRLGFDPITEKVVEKPTPVTQGTNAVLTPAISPDGSALAYVTRQSNDEIFLVKLGSSIPDQLTEDGANNLMPRWTPDGKQILFYSNADGRYQIYAMNADGSGRQRLTAADGQGAVYGIKSPTDERLAFSLFSGKTYIMDLRLPFHEQTLHETPLIPGTEYHFIAWDWSPDGRQLVGMVSTASGGTQGVYVYTVETRSYERLSETGIRPVWLNDGRRVMFIDNGRLLIADARTKQLREIYSFAPNGSTGPTLTSDNRSIYIALGESSSDIWLLALD